MKSVLITGTSRGLGFSLAKVFIERNYFVFGISRSFSTLENLYPNQYKHFYYDLKDIYNFSFSLRNFLNFFLPLELETVILNAGILGTIQEIHKTEIVELEYITKINVWSNKILLDTLFALESEKKIHNFKYILAISSGASIKGEKGWSGYAISKAALNIMIKLYANEFPQKRFISLAPGLVFTKMQEEIRQNVDLETFPNFRRLIIARETNQIQMPDETAKKILENWDKIFSFESGSYLDLRNL